MLEPVDEYGSHVRKCYAADERTYVRVNGCINILGAVEITSTVVTANATIKRQCYNEASTEQPGVTVQSFPVKSYGILR